MSEKTSQDRPQLVRSPRYGRLLDDFLPGAIYRHPWEVTLDDGLLGVVSASFQDATPLYSSRPYATALGMADRPVHPMVLLNLGLSFSVHDVSEQAIAHLAYLDVRFPRPAYRGDTVEASSRVLDVRRASSGDKGVVHVETLLRNERGDVLCAFERKALVPAGRMTGPDGSRPALPNLVGSTEQEHALPRIGKAPHDVERLPRELHDALRASSSTQGHRLHVGLSGYFEDFHPGDIIAHEVGKTIGDSEHMQLTQLFRNSHPLHFDERYAKTGFARTRVVYGGLVLGWTSALASRDTAGNALWSLSMDDGAHPNGVVAGDTLYAASKVLSVSDADYGSRAGAVVFRLVGVKNARPAELLAAGVDLFGDELSKPSEARVAAKVVEITRTLLIRRHPTVQG